MILFHKNYLDLIHMQNIIFWFHSLNHGDILIP
jgi:hypothetical protein